MSVSTWPGSWLDRLLRKLGRGRPQGGDALQAGEASADARFGGDDEPEAEWATVFDAPGLEVAHVVKARLESEGLPVALRYDTLSVVYGMTAGFNVKVQVPRALQDRALGILSEDHARPDEEEGQGDAAPGEDSRD